MITFIILITIIILAIPFIVGMIELYFDWADDKVCDLIDKIKEKM